MMLIEKKKVDHCKNTKKLIFIYVWKMNDNNTYYQRNKGRLFKQAKNRYHHKGGKEQAK